VTTTYNQQAVYSIVPATAAHGPNMVYRQTAAARDSTVRGDTSSFYYPQTYMQMTSASIHHINASNCPVPGILVQGPPPMQMYSSSHAQLEPFQSGDGNACSKIDNLRSGHSQPALQVYVPPAQRY